MVYVMLADGFEQIEAMAPIDILKRAGVDVITVGVTGLQVTSSHNMMVCADANPEDVDLSDAEMVFLPGGGVGTKNLYASDFAKNAVSYCVENDKYVAAICAAPSIVLGGMGLLNGKNATCYPSMEGGMTGAIAVDSGVVVDGKIITGRAAGASIDFGLQLVKILVGDEAAKKVQQEIVYERSGE